MANRPVRSSTTRPPRKDGRQSRDTVVPMSRVESPSVRTDDTSRDVPDDEVARRAFALYCARGGQHGHDVDDWLQAERELQTSAKSTVA